MYKSGLSEDEIQNCWKRSVIIRKKVMTLRDASFYNGYFLDGGREFPDEVTAD